MVRVTDINFLLTLTESVHVYKCGLWCLLSPCSGDTTSLKEFKDVEKEMSSPLVKEFLSNVSFY